MAKWELMVELTMATLGITVWRAKHVQKCTGGLGSEAMHISTISWIEDGSSARGGEL